MSYCINQEFKSFSFKDEFNFLWNYFFIRFILTTNFKYEWYNLSIRHFEKNVNNLIFQLISEFCSLLELDSDIFIHMLWEIKLDKNKTIKNSYEEFFPLYTIIQHKINARDIKQKLAGYFCKIFYTTYVQKTPLFNCFKGENTSYLVIDMIKMENMLANNHLLIEEFLPLTNKISNIKYFATCSFVKQNYYSLMNSYIPLDNLKIDTVKYIAHMGISISHNEYIKQIDDVIPYNIENSVPKSPSNLEFSLDNISFIDIVENKPRKTFLTYLIKSIVYHTKIVNELDKEKPIVSKINNLLNQIEGDIKAGVKLYFIYVNILKLRNLYYKLDLDKQIKNKLIANCYSLFDTIASYYALNRTIYIYNEVTKFNTSKYYSYFYDFRGRLYPNYNDWSWCNCPLLRNVIVFENNKKIHKYDMNYLTYKSIENILKLEFSETSKLNSLKLITLNAIVRIYGNILFKKKSTLEQVESTLNILNEKKEININTNLVDYHKCIEIKKRWNIIENIINEENLENYLLNNFLISIDSVTNGIIHLIGAFKNFLDPKELRELIYKANWTETTDGVDYYETVVSSMVDNLKKNIDHLLELSLKNLKVQFTDSQINIIKIFLVNNSRILIKRTWVKKPVMTSFYGSTPYRWREHIYEYMCEEDIKVLLNSYFKENINDYTYIIKNIMFLLISEELNKLDSEFLSFLLKELDNKKLNITELYLKLGNRKINLLYNKLSEQEDIKIQINKINPWVSLRYLRLTDQIDFSFKKNIRANITHALDGYHLSLITNSCKFQILTIHDCFITSVLHEGQLRQSFYKTYWEFYNKYSIEDLLYYKDKEGLENKLFEKTPYNNNHIWLSYKYQMSKAFFNLKLE